MIDNITIDSLVDNLELKKINVLIGANGAGKSTLLKEIKEKNSDVMFYDDFDLSGGFNYYAKTLYNMCMNNFQEYRHIIGIIQLVCPWFNDFIFEHNNENIKIYWLKKNDFTRRKLNELSDGAIRFINLVIILLIVCENSDIKVLCFDNPEVGLHPYAINVLGALIHTTSINTQIIIATHSIALLDEFNIDDIIIVENENNKLIYTRLHKKDYEHWLEGYSLSQLWNMNILGGRP